MIRFGVAGNSISFYAEGHKSTLEAGAWCKERGIDIFEYSFGKGVNMTNDTAQAIGSEFKKQGVALSVHAPYYINLSNPDPEMILKSYGYILRSAEKVRLFGGDRVVIHPATQGKMNRENALRLALENARGLRDVLDAENLTDVKICFETMGKLLQIGTVDEIIKMCQSDPRFYPCIDFGHINAREQGVLKNKLNYNTILQKLLDFLPKEKVFHMHAHFSKIQYGPKGELKHLTFADQIYGPEFYPLAEALAEKGLEPTIICESDGTQAEDAMTMKKEYFECRGNL